MVVRRRQAALTLMRTAVALLGLCGLPSLVAAQHDHHQGMDVSASGIVMNENVDRLPRGCDEISREHELTVRAGRQYASGEPGVIYGMDSNALQVDSCSRVTVHFINEDEVRHQWMVHGLPRYLYPGGMFHIEAMGGQQQTGTFIAPAGDGNYLIHCDMAQHMEKGMRGQLMVGAGGGKLWAVTGLSDAFRRAPYLPGWSVALLVLVLVAAFVTVLAWTARRGHG